LGREPVAPNELLLGRTIVGKTVLITGAGGSIGSELCRQIAQSGAHRLVLFEQSEFSLYAIEKELRHIMMANQLEDLQIVPVLGSVTDAGRLKEILSRWTPDTIFHAAAYKHVPMVEANPVEGIRNNLFGTYEVVNAAHEAGVSDFILISTDKAVRPTNVMGASKRGAEQVVQAFAAISETRFSMVRFGNVLGSSGSVVPLFRQQIESGGPITLTHRDVTRYFMTIPEASQLVIQAGGMAKGGEVFVLDMGKSVRIADLAKTMVQLSGLTVRDDGNPDGDIEIREIGLRPGEKLYEELIIGNNPEKTVHDRIMMAHEDYLSRDELELLMEQFRDSRDRSEVIALLNQLVPEFAHERDNDAEQQAS
ncbi:MAG: nucleoside-diphosphate sugar epimerase/dehydratase, partial [Pseudomonadota bacterium]